MSVAGAYWKARKATRRCNAFTGVLLHAAGAGRLFAQLRRGQARDHRRLGQELDLFSIQEEAGPGLIFWHRRAASVRKLMEDWLARDEFARRGYDLVYTPHIMRLDLWKTSGHTDFYRETRHEKSRVSAKHFATLGLRFIQEGPWKHTE